MTNARILLTISTAACLVSGQAAAQTYAPRSADYMFAATANDARAIWVNPAGLAVMPEASLMAEFVLQRPVDQETRLSQVTVGFNSQGLSFGYNRERLVPDSSNHTYRIALARALHPWTLGMAVSHHRSGLNDTGIDVGIRYLLMPSVQLGAVVRNIGQPQIRNDTLPVTGVAGLGWSVLPGMLLVTGEAQARNRLRESGYDMAYRAGAELSFGGALPIAGLTAVSFDSDFGVTMWWFGVSLGSRRRAVAVVGVTPDDPSVRVENASITGLATNPLSAWRR